MCGVVGVVAQSAVNQVLFDALTLLQHRGQDAAGIVTEDQGRLKLKKGRGLVREVFHTGHMVHLSGQVGIGHVRYPTAGTDSEAEAQPFYVNSPYGIALAHNGNLTNARGLQKELTEINHRHLNTDSDSEVILNVLAHEIQAQGKSTLTPADLFAAVTKLHARCRGAYAVITLITNHGILAFRDPHGIRPLVLGKRETATGTAYMVASETVAFAADSFVRVGDVLPGEAIYIESNGALHRQLCATHTTYTPCMFEMIYLARPDSVIDGISVYKMRLNCGGYLAEQILESWPNPDIDVVIPIPETSRSSAVALANRLNVPFREGFVKNRYIGRTFIMPGQKIRKKSVRQKLNTIDLEFDQKNVLLVDDSIVRGTTSKEIVQMARQAGAKNVYFATACPPIRHPNVYGIDMPIPEELIAHGRTIDEICTMIGADRLFFLEQPGLVAAARAVNREITQFEMSVFDGKYITGDESKYLKAVAASRSELGRSRTKREISTLLDLYNVDHLDD